MVVRSFITYSALDNTVKSLSLNYQDFRKLVRFGDFTAFAVMLPDGRFEYSSGIINDSVFDLVSKETEFEVFPLDSDRFIENLLANNFLCEIRPACGVYDDSYSNIRGKLVRGEAKVGVWLERGRGDLSLCLVTRYMLIL